MHVNIVAISSQLFLFTRPVKMAQTECSETAYKMQMLGKHPKEGIKQSRDWGKI
jgi:hypothetical protein